MNSLDLPTLSPIKQMELEAAKISNPISLAQGIPCQDTPELIKQAAIKAIENGTAAYYSPPQGLPGLRKVISAHLRRRGQVYDWQDEIIVTAGASEAIVTALRSCIKRTKNEVIVFSPSYAGYVSMIAAVGGSVKYAYFKPTDWSVDAESLLAVVSSKTAAILIAHPNNPSGHMLKKDDIEFLLTTAEKHNCYVISDEVYSDLVFGDGAFTSCADLPFYRNRVIRVHSLSKSFAMTGWRVAYVHSDSSVISQLLPLHDAIITCAPVVSQYAAIAAFDNYQILVNSMKQFLTKQRSIACKELNMIKTSPNFPQAAYFVFLPTPYDGRAFASFLLNEYSVSVVPGDAFGPGYSNYIRICFGRKPEHVRLGCRIIYKCLNKEYV